MSLALDELSECVPSNVMVEDEIMAAELSKTLNRFIANLPAAERQVFLCRYLVSGFNRADQYRFLF